MKAEYGRHTRLRGRRRDAALAANAGAMDADAPHGRKERAHRELGKPRRTRFPTAPTASIFLPINLQEEIRCWTRAHRRLSRIDHFSTAVDKLGSFSWRWPEKTEHFERGYAALVRFEGGEFRIRHGISRRTVYGRPRLHSVTWVENRPTVEGVEADDFAHSRSLLSLIKVTKRHLRPTDPLPPKYAGFTVGVMSEEAAGRYSPRSLAVKIRLDDIEGWSRHALFRSAAWGRLGTERRLRSSLPATTAPGPGPEEIPARSGDGHAVAAALLQYDSKKREPNSTGSTLDFTPNAETNELLRTDAFAFLTAVLFDQGVPAERAWTAPYLLRQRMGHLDPARSAGDPEGVRRAIQMQPKLHRYIKKMPRWLVGAARRVEQDYHGDASAIWSDRPSAVELQRRLSEFHGIGQKKAAMAVVFV